MKAISIFQKCKEISSKRKQNHQANFAYPLPFLAIFTTLFQKVPINLRPSSLRTHISVRILKSDTNNFAPIRQKCP